MVESQAAGGECRRSYTAGYLLAHRHFVIQNLPAGQVAKPWRQILKVALNLLQRGEPTRMSGQLCAALEEDAEGIAERVPPLLINGQQPDWGATIKGQDASGNFPARVFFEEILVNRVSPLAQSLLLPEARFDQLIDDVPDAFVEQVVDFYLPDRRLVIEVDGDQHDQRLQAEVDRSREALLDKRGIRTLRIRSRDVAAGSQNLDDALREIEDALASYQPFSSLDFDSRSALGVVAAFRLQVCVLELLLAGKLPISGVTWRLAVRSREAELFAEPALADVQALVGDLAAAAGIDWDPPALDVIEDAEYPAESSDRVTIDVSVAQRWSEGEAQRMKCVLVRSDYVLERPDAGGVWRPVNSYRVLADDPLVYPLDGLAPRAAMERLLLRLFNLEEFRPGQWEVLCGVLRRQKTLGVLPTGHGKSLCYQLAAMLQPGCTVVVSPLKSLMYDQVAELAAVGFSRVACITSNDAPADKARKVEDFSEGCYQVLLVSPERFQVKEFREAALSLQQDLAVHHTVVDEVHCLSEWGHDFRLSYLNLAKTLRRLFPGAVFLGLTATASANVLRDISVEFDLRDERIVYRLDLHRPNLKFQVRTVVRDRYWSLVEWLSDRVLEDPSHIPSGIVFTPHVNGRKGCYDLATRLSAELGVEVGAFSGSRPKNLPAAIDHEELKMQTQARFKSGELRLLCATKAFGMGVNKRDVRFTAHIGVPSSMEALYQEGGRAGRDNLDADCLVFVSGDSAGLDSAFSRNVRPADLKRLVDSSRGDSDVRDQLWLMTKELRSIDQDYKLTKAVLENLENRGFGTVHVSTPEMQANRWRVNAQEVQMAIYRLTQLGFVDDWTVEDFIRGEYVVDSSKIDDSAAESRLLRLVNSYSGEGSIERLEDVCEGDEQLLRVAFQPSRSRRDRALILLLSWSFSHFNYARRQSLKKVYDLCQQYAAIGPEEFRHELERFFHIDQRTRGIQEFVDSGLDASGEWAAFLGVNQGDAVDGSEPIGRRRAELLEIKGMIDRLLESYRANTALDMLSAGVRLLLGIYDDPDGSGRLRGQLAMDHWSEEERGALLSFALRVGRKASARMQELLAADLAELFDDRASAAEICRELDCELSSTIYLEALAGDAARLIDVATTWT